MPVTIRNGSYIAIQLGSLFNQVKFSQLMPLVCSCQVTVVSVASPTSGASQKSVALPVNVALGQQILTVQQSTSVSPVKVATSQSTTQVT